MMGCLLPARLLTGDFGLETATTKSGSVLVGNPQDVSGERGRVGVGRRQVTGPVDLLAVGQTHLLQQRLPASAILLSDGRVKIHLRLFILPLPPVQERRLKLIRQVLPRLTRVAKILFSVAAHQLAFMTTNGAFDDRFGAENRGRTYLGLIHASTLNSFATLLQHKSQSPPTEMQPDGRFETPNGNKKAPPLRRRP